jgi:putative heme iron utilization protein
MSNTDGNRDLQTEAREFLNANQSLILGTVSDDGEPNASYAPFVRNDDSAFYVYVSELAQHTPCLLANGKCSVLVLEDEAMSSEIFARRRLTFACSATPIERESSAWITLMDVFEAKFPKTMPMLRPLKDFVLFQLTPERGTYVRGFAQAYRFTGEDLENLHHINDAGHRA